MLLLFVGAVCINIIVVAVLVVVATLTDVVFTHFEVVNLVVDIVPTTC